MSTLELLFLIRMQWFVNALNASKGFPKTALQEILFAAMTLLSTSTLLECAPISLLDARPMIQPIIIVLHVWRRSINTPLLLDSQLYFAATQMQVRDNGTKTCQLKLPVRKREIPRPTLCHSTTQSTLIVSSPTSTTLMHQSTMPLVLNVLMD